MRPFQIVAWLSALAITVLGGSPLDAAWCNVFQVCCQNCQSTAPSVSAYAYPSTAYAYPSTATAYYPYTSYAVDPGCCPDPCPPVCTTQYVQRSYYQPVTSYENRVAYEAVTSYRTSYYWSPVTSYRVSSYFDPCTCCYRQVSVPCTSYQLRSQCCPVQSWVARCVSVPVTTQQLVTYYEPVTSCCSTTVPAAPAVPAAPPSYNTPVVPSMPPADGARINEQRSLPPPPTNGSAPLPSSPSQNLTPAPVTPPAGSLYNRQYTPSPAANPTRATPPAVQLDRIVAIPGHNVEGDVVRADRSVDAGARLMFKRIDQLGESQTVKADHVGRFRTTLTAGVWDVYTHNTDGILVAQARIRVSDNETRQVRLTSR